MSSSRSRWRRIGAILCLVGLTLSVSAPFATAATSRTAAEPAPTSDYTDPCANTPTTATVATGAESTTSSSSSSRSGVSAVVDVQPGVYTSSGFQTCTGISNYRSGPFVGVGIQPKLEHPSINGAHGMFLGTILCGGGIGFDTYCQAPTPHYILSYGKCTNGNSVIIDLGPASYAAHTFAIYLNTDQRWYFSIDGSVKFSIPNSYNSCWGNTRKAIWLGHRWDFGDSFGDDSTHATRFDTMRFGVYGQGWFNANLGPINCVHYESDASCQIPDSDTMIIWTQT